MSYKLKMPGLLSGHFDIREEDNLQDFWSSSWKSIDPERIEKYVRDFNMEPDEIIAYLHAQMVKTVCDAGCGCGAYALKLVKNGFMVSGFDLSEDAVKIAGELLEKASVNVELKTASVLYTGYPDDLFDCVISRDVIDHMTKHSARLAIQELYRITKPGGILIVTLDQLDAEYQLEIHTVTGDGDYVFTDGKWKGMVFHPYSKTEALELIPHGAVLQIEEKDGLILKVKKPA